MANRSKALLALPLMFLVPGAGLVHLGRPLLGSIWALGILLLSFGAVLLTAQLEPMTAAWTYNGLFGFVILLWAGQALCTIVLTIRAYRGAPYEPRLPMAIALIVFCTALSMATSNLRARYGVVPFVVPTGSMKPTLEPGDRVLVRSFPEGTTGKAFRGSVVLHRMDGDASAPEGTLFIKRVVAAAGDEVTVQADCTVLVNGTATAPPGRSGDPVVPLQCTPSKATLAPKQLFLLGDNRDNSRDSRHHGPIDESTVVGNPFTLWFARPPGGPTHWHRIGIAL